MDKWVGKTAVVTGASAGIGAAIVRDFAKAGINVVALARRTERLDELKKELSGAPGSVTAVNCDVSKKESVEQAFAEIERLFGVIHILINNAGIGRHFSVFGDENDDKKTFELIDEVIHTNFSGLMYCTRKGFHLIEKSNDYGIIINIGSILGHSVPNNEYKYNVYPGTKHAVRATTEALRQELVNKKNNKIRVAEISPGIVATEIVEAAGITSFSYDSVPALKDHDIAQSVNFLLMTPYTVNITELVIKPVGERM